MRTPLTREEQRQLLDDLTRKHNLVPRSNPIKLRDDTGPLPAVPAHLTAREIEILLLVAEGCANADVGKRVFLSQDTIKAHMRHIIDKLDARNRTHAVAIAIRQGLI